MQVITKQVSFAGKCKRQGQVIKSLLGGAGRRPQFNSHVEGKGPKHHHVLDIVLDVVIGPGTIHVAGDGLTKDAYHWRHKKEPLDHLLPKLH